MHSPYNVTDQTIITAYVSHACCQFTDSHNCKDACWQVNRVHLYYVSSSSVYIFQLRRTKSVPFLCQGRNKSNRTIRMYLLERYLVIIVNLITINKSLVDLIDSFPSRLSTCTVSRTWVAISHDNAWSRIIVIIAGRPKNNITIIIIRSIRFLGDLIHVECIGSDFRISTGA